MLNVFSALLEARDPALGRFRSYRLAAGTDLFGAWLVEVEYGRIGASGRGLRYVAGDEAEARRLVARVLRRRATAEKRIGVPYRFRELTDPWQWLSLPAEESVLPAPRGITMALFAAGPGAGHRAASDGRGTAQFR